VSRLNRAPVGTHIRVAPATWRVLRAAAKFSADSGGVFDVTLPVLKANWRALDLLAGGGVRRLDDVCVDLGGIAKGFAVDAAIAALRRSGIVDGGVNAGGDLRRIGASPELVHVRHPGALDRWVAVGELATGAIATSANYLDPVNAGRLHRSDGRAVWIGAGSVSVQARSCMTADALTKIVAAIGPHDSIPILRRHRATAFVLAPSGAAWVAGADGVTSVSAERFQEVDHAA
jgi:thiamine biosynthesis lipoprotein